QQEHPDQRRYSAPSTPRAHRLAPVVRGRLRGGDLRGTHPWNTCSAACCHWAKMSSTWSGWSRKRVRAVSAVVCSSSLESRLKNWVSWSDSSSSVMPFWIMGEKPEVSTSVDVGRNAPPALAT